MSSEKNTFLVSDCSRRRVLKLSTAAILMALGVVLASFLSIPIPPAKVYPAQHLINAIAGVLLGPIWAALVGLGISIIRNALGLGTIFAFPGGIPGGVIVGCIYWMLRRILDKDRRKWAVVGAAISEPLGTVVIGATISGLFVAPLIGSTNTVAFFWWSFAISCIPGSIIGAIVLLTLEVGGVIRFYETPSQ